MRHSNSRLRRRCVTAITGCEELEFVRRRFFIHTTRFLFTRRGRTTRSRPSLVPAATRSRPSLAPATTRSRPLLVRGHYSFEATIRSRPSLVPATTRSRPLLVRGHYCPPLLVRGHYSCCKPVLARRFFHYYLGPYLMHMAPQNNIYVQI